MATTGLAALDYRIYRHRPEIHKRCMLVATTILLVAAVGRMQFLGTPPNALQLLVWPLPVYMAMLYDYATKRLIRDLGFVNCVRASGASC